MDEQKIIAISGANGFIGARLKKALERRGYQVVSLLRRPGIEPSAIFYDYENELMEQEKLAGCWAIIHLAGKNLMSGLWTKRFKEEVYDSRIKSTHFIAKSLAKGRGPKILLNASATGFYGDRGDERLDEDSPPGEGFLAKLCSDWEKATQVASEAGVRVVNMRFGVVLDPLGGMLKSLSPLLKLGLAGTFGDGKQYLPYITLDHLLQQIEFLLEEPKLKGPVNLVDLPPATNQQMIEALAPRLRCKVFSWPAPLLRLLGDQRHALLDSARVYPKRLLEHGFLVSEQGIENALEPFFSSWRV